MSAVRFDPEAKAEFLAAIGYYENCQIGMGKKFRHLVETVIAKISETPFLFRIQKAPFRRCLLPKYPYAVIFTIEPDHIRVVAIAHTRRKPEYWVERG